MRGKLMRAPDTIADGIDARDARVGRVVWITGLSGAGKSTLAEETIRLLRTRGEHVVGLDGDALREVFGATGAENHGRAARLALAFQYARLSRLLAMQGATVVIATISLFREIHVWNRLNLPGYFEVYLKVPLAELRRRDPKDIYRRFEAGLLSDVAGLDMQVDEPAEADWVVEFSPTHRPIDLATTLTRRLYERESHECTIETR